MDSQKSGDDEHDDTQRGREKQKTVPPKKDGTVAITVSPFDGPNRIRFKGSPGLGIAEFGLRILETPQLVPSITIVGLSAVLLISDERLRASDNPHSAITNPQSLRLPRNLFGCQYDLNSRTDGGRAQPGYRS